MRHEGREPGNKPKKVAPRGKWGAIAERAEAQRGVFDHDDLIDAGFEPDEVQYHLRAEKLVRVHKGVYALGHLALREGWREQAALLAVGVETALGYRSAAAWRGYVKPRGRVHVITANRNGRDQPDFRLHRCPTLQERDIEPIDGLRCCKPARIAVDVAATEPALLPRIFREMELRREDFGRIWELLEEAPRRRGARALKEQLATFDPISAHTFSDLERRLLRAARRLGLTPLINTLVEGQLVDAFFPELRLVVELDHSYTHLTPSAFVNDRARSNELQAQGYRTLRFTEHTSEDEMVAVLRRFLARGAKTLG